MHAHFAGASQDGTHVFIETVESLVAADTDSSTDVYERYGGGTSLLTNGTTGGNGAYDAVFRGVSPDGKRVFFRTAEALVSADTDLVPDVYSANVPGTVTVQLNAMPDHAQDFSFTAIGLEAGSFNFGPLGFGPTTFSLDDDPDPALTNTEVFGQVTPGVGYSVSQTVPAGWDLDRRDMRRRQPGREHRRGRRRGGHLHLHGPEARPSRGGRRRACRTTPRTSRSPPAAGSPRRASRSTTTPTARCPTP